MEETHPLQEFAGEALGLLGLVPEAIAVHEDGRRGSITVALELSPREMHEAIEALNHVVARYAERRSVPAVFFDINGYRAEREGLIARLASAAAERVAEAGVPVELPPMNSYERRIVHATVSLTPGIASVSTGLGRERHVVVARAQGQEASGEE